MDHTDHSRHRLIYILRYLISYTDAEHTISINILRNYLKAQYNIDVGRPSPGTVPLCLRGRMM